MKGRLEEDYEYLQEDVRVLKEQLEKAYLELDEYDVKFEVFEELEKKAKSAEERGEEIEELYLEKEKMLEEMRNLRKEFDEYQKKYEAKVRSEATGEEFATLEVGDRTLNEVVIRSVTETAVKIGHADGFATLNSTTAPAEWTRRFFLRSEDEIAERAEKLAALLNPPVVDEFAEEQQPSRPLSEYQKTRLVREAEQEAFKTLGSKVETAIVSISGENATGSGFFAQDGITTYLYTSAKLLDQNPGLSIKDKNGREWKKFGDLEVSLEHDLVRMAVTEPVEKPLKLHPIGQEVETGSNLAMLSLVKGGSMPSQTLAQTRGIKDDLYEVFSSELQSFVGGPLVNSEGEVVAIITQPLVVRRQVFEDRKNSYQRVRPIACRLDLERKWEKTTLGRFVAAGRKLATFDQSSLFLFALGQVEPRQDGVSLDTRVQGNLTIREALITSKQPGVLKKLTEMNNELSGGRKLSKRDVDKKFRLLFQAALNKVKSKELDEGSFSPFHRPEVAISNQFRGKALDALQQKLESVR